MWEAPEDALTRWAEQSWTNGAELLVSEVPPLSISREVSNASQPSVSSALHDAARITDWDSVYQLCQEDPASASYQGRDGLTALHHACNRRCPHVHVVQALLQAYPEALELEVQDGWFPLHYACRFKTPKEVVRLLLYQYPDKAKATVSKRDRLGRTPLYYAVRYDAPPGVVSLLLEVDPSVVLDETRDSPLALIWDSWAEVLEGRRALAPYLESEASQLDKRLQRDRRVRPAWNQANMLLKAAFGFDESTQRPWRIVHATAAIQCHMTLFQLACALYPEQARELDEFDLRRPGQMRQKHQTALHLAAKSTAPESHGVMVMRKLFNLYPEGALVADGNDGSLPLHHLASNERHSSVGWFVDLCPEAVRVPDSHGRLPLHRAAAVHRAESRVIAELLEAYPEGAAHTDEQGYTPLHWMSRSVEHHDSDMEKLYEAHRRAVQQRANGSLPLHLAASSLDSQASLLDALVGWHPRAAAMPDSHGRLPLHLALELGKDWKNGVATIYEAHPDAVREATNNGWLALHLVADCASAKPDLVRTVLSKNRDAAGVSDPEGRYPLHLACRSGKRWSSVLEELLEAYPPALGTADRQGHTPFHVAALRYCWKEMEHKDESSQRQAEEIEELEVLFELLKADPTVL